MRILPTHGCQITAAAALALLVLLSAPACEAALTRQQRQELLAIKRELGKIASLIRQRKLDEATQAVDAAEERLKKVAGEAGLADDDRVLAPIKKLIERRRDAIDKRRGSQEPDKPDTEDSPDEEERGVSFTRDVASILARDCLDCHAENPKAGLRLDTFAGMQQGGRSGPLLVVGQADRSLILARLLAPPQERMPKNRKPLARDDIVTIATWINQGAKFDAEDNQKTVSLPKLATNATQAAGEKRNEIHVAIARATGNEKVSFTKQIAPFMGNLCLRCHSGVEPRSGFSLETFEKLMIGGDSGQVVVPGSLEQSRLWDLVGKQDPIKMPMGPARITRTNWNDLRTWILEGAKFDGGDPAAPLLELVPRQDEMRKKELGGRTPNEFAELRRRRTQRQWEQALPNAEPTVLDTDDFLLYGDVKTARLQQVAAWAEEHARTLRSWFGEQGGSSKTLVKGRLAIFVLKDRFGFNEFHIELRKRGAPSDTVGFAHVSDGQQDALLCLQDVGDAANENRPGLRCSLVRRLSEAYLDRRGSNLPRWVAAGTGLALAAALDTGDEYFAKLRMQVPEAIRAVKQSEDVFRDGSVSVEHSAAVAYTLVSYLLHNGGQERYRQFVEHLNDASGVPQAIQQVYGAEAGAVARRYMATFSN